MITKKEREWIETQLQANGLKGQAAKNFTSGCIQAFNKKNKHPKKQQDFAKIDWTEVLPGYQEYLNTK